MTLKDPLYTLPLRLCLPLMVHNIASLFFFLPRCVVTKPPASVTSLGQARTAASGIQCGTPIPQRTKDLRVCVISVLHHCRLFFHLHSPAATVPRFHAFGRRHTRICHFAGKLHSSVYITFSRAHLSYLLA